MNVSKIIEKNIFYGAVQNLQPRVSFEFASYSDKKLQLEFWGIGNGIINKILENVTVTLTNEMY